MWVQQSARQALHSIQDSLMGGEGKGGEGRGASRGVVQSLTRSSHYRLAPPISPLDVSCRN